MRLASARSPFSCRGRRRRRRRRASRVTESKYTNGLRNVAYGAACSSVCAAVGIGLPEGGMGARARLRAGFVDALHVRPPGEVLGGQLPGERLRGGRVHAAVAEHLFVGAGARGRDGGVVGAVGRRFRRRPLAAEQGHLVGQLLVRDRVVADEQLSLLLERPGQVGSRGGRSEHRRVGLVGEHDHEHVLDRRQLRGRGAGGGFGGSAFRAASRAGARAGRRRSSRGPFAVACRLPAVAGVGVGSASVGGRWLRCRTPRRMLRRSRWRRRPEEPDGAGGG